MGDSATLPRIKGATVRRFRDASDFVAMSRVSQRSWLGDGFEWLNTEADIANTYESLGDRDPREELIMIESDGEVIGYGDISWETADSNTTLLWNFVHLLPEWRSRGIRESVFAFNEAQLLQRAKRLGLEGYYQTWACDEPNDWKNIVLSNGYSPTWHLLEMIRPDIGRAPDFPLPKGLEVRPVPPDRYKDVWEGMMEAYRSEPWYSAKKFDEEHFKAWHSTDEFEPELWQVAWDGDRVVGAVQNYVNKRENEVFGTRRGHTERIFVAQDWQHKGVAKALISRSLKLLAGLGMTEAALDVNTANLSGAMHLYRGLGYAPVRTFTFYRKPLSY